MAPAKKLINDADDVVDEMIKGILLTYPTLRRLEGYDVLARSDFERVKHTQVALISGGGSGHEPAHAGFIGDGMLTAAVCGGVFASPSVDSILATILTVSGDKGCLLIVKNYTGDRLNFGLAAEMAKSQGIKVAIVFVADDYALKPEKGVTGRRGLAGTVLVHKIAGATAKAGGTLEDVVEAARAASDAVATIGVSLSTCTVPGNALSDRLHANDGKMELGLGIHGEAGLETLDMLPAGELVTKMCEMILRQFDERSDSSAPSSAPTQRDLVVLLNNLGGTTAMEMFVLANSVVELFSKENSSRSVTIARMYVAPVMTSLEMAGFSITLMELPKESKDQVLTRLDANTNAPGWPLQNFQPVVAPPHISPASIKSCYSTTTSSAQESPKDSSEKDEEIRAAVKSRIVAAAQAVVDAETQLTEWDTIVGDGDCGETFRRGALSVIEESDKESDKETFCRSPAAAFQTMSQLAMKMGGTSGAVLAIFFRACHGYCLKHSLTTTQSFLAAPNVWVEIVHAGTEAISTYGGAKRGMRTLLDALLGLEDALRQVKGDVIGAGEFESIREAVMAAAKGTAQMQAAAGRSNYLRDEVTKGVPDPGAMALGFAAQAMLK